MAKKKRADVIKDQRRNRAQGPEPEVLDLDLTEERPEEEPEGRKIELFKYKDTTYYMAEPSATMMLDLIEAAGERGEMGAVHVMLTGLMGEDTYRVLKGIPGLTKDELSTVINRVMYFSMDVMDEIMGE